MLDVSLSDHTLAVWGAITGSLGSLGGAIALLNKLRDRPRLVLLTYTQYRGFDRKLVMTVVNHGRRPAVILEAGIAIRVHRVWVGRFRRRRPQVGGEFGQPDAGMLPATLVPWGTLQWSYAYKPERQPPPDAVPFVRDSHGRYVWASYRRPKPSGAPSGA